MNFDTFWQLIDDTRHAADGDPRRQSQLLRAALADTTTETITRFDEIFHDLRDRAFRAELWEAAYVIKGGCSDDGFLEFREWLISRGKAVYDQALANPESLADVIDVGEIPDLYPILLGVAGDAYEQLTGQEMPVHYRTAPKLHGELHAEELIPARFPILAAKFLEA